MVRFELSVTRRSTLNRVTFASPKQKALYRTLRKDIATLTSPRISLARKRKVIQNHKSGFFFIPALIGAALGAVVARSSVR